MHGIKLGSEPTALASVKRDPTYFQPFIRWTSTVGQFAPVEKLEKWRCLSETRYFFLYLPGPEMTERFEWRPSQCAEVQALRHSIGMKLVRVRTHEIVAAFAFVSGSKTKRAKVEFYDDREKATESGR